MAKKQMTLGLINMFISEVENLFAPLTAQVEARESNLKIEADMTARKELNIFELTMKQAKLELELNETKRQIKVFTEYSYINGHRMDSVYEQKVRQILRELREKNPTLREVEKAKQDVIREVRLAALGDDMKLVLTTVVPRIVADLTEKIRALPPVKEMKELPSID